MSLLVVYIILVALGQAVGVVIGLSVDEFVNKGIGLIAFLISFFAVFVIAWFLAVRITRPSEAKASSSS